MNVGRYESLKGMNERIEAQKKIADDKFNAIRKGIKLNDPIPAILQVARSEMG